MVLLHSAFISAKRVWRTALKTTGRQLATTGRPPRDYRATSGQLFEHLVRTEAELLQIKVDAADGVLKPYRIFCHQGENFILEVVKLDVGFGAAIVFLRGDDDKIHGCFVGIVVNPGSGIDIDGFLLQMVKGGLYPGVVRMAEHYYPYG